LDLDALSRIVRDWSLTIPEIREAYIFGSRAKGTFRDDSDLDVAIRLEGDDEGFVVWMHDAEEFRRSLGVQIPVPLDLQLIHSTDRIVMPAVLEHGVKVFERSDQ
jgi:predicted nucleotidyltransferase